MGVNAMAMVVAADALVRRAWALGRAADLLVPTLIGDFATQYSFDRELAREGHDLSSLEPSALAARLAGFHEERRLATAEVLARLSVTADLGAVDSVADDVARAARIAFVRLFEEGVVEETDRVVSTCPRCRTVLNPVDTEEGELASEQITLRLPASDGADFDLALCAPELLPGAVAVIVGEGAPSAGSTVRLPIADRDVPVIAGDPGEAPSIVVPMHDGSGQALAIANGLAAISVLDADGIVRVEGPLDGLGRYAARAEARAILESDGMVISTEEVEEAVWRCRCCGTVLVPQLGRHWFLRAGDLEVAAADAVRDGLVVFSPPDARDAFLACAGARSDWCLSTTVGGGVDLPASVCSDCGKTTVEVDSSSSCGRCMGVLVQVPLHLDARFVAAIWAVTLSGWPGRADAPSLSEETLAVVGIDDLSAWVLPAMALGLRLTGASPFATAVVHPWPSVVASNETFLVAETDTRVLRMALVAGTEDLEVARAAVAALDLPAGDDVDPFEVADAVADGVSSLDDGAPAQAAVRLASALRAGVPADAAERLRALALPIMGE